ncbi:uncharacterized protein ELE39_001673 [Cryptosporidium sp. chipmunk genotype I]|uniref:uncharacterized protein n=1 Tax=Cryptosporidium sp. chipmunk genotype I TaxID=1280935 RepID=UPI003519DC3A|nr:hypothetical protein ELE39_001673 [Cryptosporidium sp. chipmunk genotype I]
MIFLLLLLLISTNFIQCKDFENSLNEVLKVKAAKLYKSNKSGTNEVDIVSNTPGLNQVVNSIMNTINLQILGLYEANELREFKEIKAEQRFTQQPNLDMRRLTYKAIFETGIGNSVKPFYTNIRHLSIGERLIIQSSKFSFAAKRNKTAGMRCNKSHISIIQNKCKNDLKCALKELISKTEIKDVEKAGINSKSKGALEGELEDIKVINMKKKITNGSDLVKGIIGGIREELKSVEEKKSSSNLVELLIPQPPNRNADTNFENDNLDTNNDYKNSTISSRSLFQHLTIPDIFENSIGENHPIKKKTYRRSLPPGAELELEEFFARQSKRNFTENDSKASIGARAKYQMMREHKRLTENGNPYKPSDINNKIPFINENSYVAGVETD